MFHHTIISTTLVIVFIMRSQACQPSVDQDDGIKYFVLCLLKYFVSEKFLFAADDSRDAANIVQCLQAGVEKCRPVTIDTEYTRSLKEGDYVKMIQDLNLEMQVQLVHLPSKEIINLGYLPSKNLCKIFIF